jgi:DNA/RNA endonuclease G (NUC1)
MHSAPLRSAMALLLGLGVTTCTDLPTAPLPLTPSGAMMSGALSGPAVVISQVYGGGGNSGATYTHDFIELFNRGTEPVSVDGWSVQYASSTGTSWQVTSLSGTIQPGRYYLIRQAAGAGGTTPLPTPEASGSIAMAAGAGKVLLASQTTVVSATACPTGTAVIDRVGYGGTNCATDWTSNAPTLTNTTAAIRNENGCAWTGSPAVDFSSGAPTPRNGASPAVSCGGEAAEPATVEVAPDSTSITEGATQAFTAVVRDSEGEAISASVTWSSSDTDIATIDAATGVATGVAPGVVTITATTTNEIAGTARLVVTAAPTAGSADVLISQIYGGGGNAGSFYRNDFIELFNRGEEAVNLSGWRVWYASAAGTTWQSAELSGTIQPGRYYLIQQAAGTGGTANLPSPDAVGTINMGATAGKVVLTQPGTTLTGACPVLAGMADRVGFGTNDTENGCVAVWGARTANLANTTAAFRKNDGCQNTGVAGSDFTVHSPLPRNSASPQKNCTQPERPQSAATILINELMGDPANAESASWGQWFEVHNYGDAPVDLMGWLIISQGTNQPDHTINAHVVVPAGGYAVLGRGADETRNGGITLDYNYFVGNATTIWLDSEDYLMLVDAGGARVDSAAWSSMPRGVTRALRDPAQPDPNADGANWGYSTTTFGLGDYGTPGAANGALASTPPFVSPNSVTITGRTASDAPLPAGFEAQLFATLRDPANQILETTFTWSSLTPAIASIDERGVMRGLSAGTAVFRATAADGAFRNHAITVETPMPGATAEYGNNTEFGDPMPTTTVSEFIVRRTQFTTSWNGGRGIPNWVAYNLNGTQIQSGQDRCNCFTFDPLVEAAGFPRYNTADYTGVGGSAPFHGYPIDRGHLVRSFDRTTGTLDNAVTYYFSNVIPQAADLNQGPWAVMEEHLGNLARFSDREVYIYAGATGHKGTVKNEGKIVIPEWNWKVAVVMPRGMGLTDVRDYRDLEVVAAVMPNEPGIRNNNWETMYQVLADSVEKLSGYTLLGALPGNVQRALKLGNQPPIAKQDGPYLTTEDSPVTMSGAASLDPNGTIVSYTWLLGDGTSRSGATVTHSYALSGVYTVRLIVADNDGLVDTSTTIAQVNRIPPPEALKMLVAYINELVTLGVLNNGNGNSLKAKLLAAVNQLEMGGDAAFAGQIDAFVNEVAALERGGRLAAEYAGRLRFEARRLARPAEMADGDGSTAAQ